MRNADPHDFVVRPYESNDRSSVIELWERSGLTRPWNDPGLDIDRKLQINKEWFLVGFLGDRLVASVMAGYEGHRGWINYLAVDPDHQKQGLGREIMGHAEQCLVAVGCPKINLQIRKDNIQAIAFYERIGFLEDDVVSFGKRLNEDDQLIFKLISAKDWDQAQTSEHFPGVGIDLQDGFIHLSSKQQVAQTARLYFAGQKDLLLLSVSSSALGDTLRWESSRNGELFPHVYGPIPFDAIRSVDAVPCGEDGSHVLPSNVTQ